MAFSITPQQQPAQQQMFTPQQPSPFQQTSPFFQSQLQQQQHQLQPFQQQQQQLQLQQFQQQQQPQLYLFTNEKAPASYSTKWADLHPDSQKHLLQIEERIREYRDESQRLEQCSRLYDSSVSSDGFESDASLTVQELGGISTSIERQKAITEELMAVVKDMLRNTEVAVRSFLMLRPRFLHLKSGVATNSAAIVQASGATGTSQPLTTAAAPVFDFYSGVPRKPSPFLHQTVARFDKQLGECLQLIEELEQLLLVDSDRNGYNSGTSLLQALPKTMSNVHDFFVHVVAKVESIHQYIGSMRTAYLANQRRLGLYNDPFLEADRRETAKEEAAARRVHPTLHLPVISQQPSTQVSGLTTSTISAAPQTSTAMPTVSSASGSSIFATPAAGTSSSSLFSTPATAAPTSSPSLFGSSAAPVQTSLFGTSTPALGSTSLFASTPSATVPSFSTPFPSAAVPGSGASFGTASKPRAKARTGRR